MSTDNEVTIVVTGFGPSDDANRVSPSYLIATTLPRHFPPTPSNPTGVHIVLHPYQVSTSYDEVRELVPRLYEAYHDRADMILHMGTTAHRNFYAIEKCGHRDGYEKQFDYTGATPPPDDAMNYWKDCPEVLNTTLPFDDIWTRWRSKLLLGAADSPPELDGVVLRPSEDAGHFLCDFLYYSTLAEYWRKSQEIQMQTGEERMEDRPALFMQVPGRINGGDDLKTGRLVTMALIRALSESWTAKKRANSGTKGVGEPGSVKTAIKALLNPE